MMTSWAFCRQQCNKLTAKCWSFYGVLPTTYPKNRRFLNKCQNIWVWMTGNNFPAWLLSTKHVHWPDFQVVWAHLQQQLFIKVTVKGWPVRFCHHWSYWNWICWIKYYAWFLMFVQVSKNMIHGFQCPIQGKARCWDSKDSTPVYISICPSSTAHQSTPISCKYCKAPSVLHLSVVSVSDWRVMLVNGDLTVNFIFLPSACSNNLTFQTAFLMWVSAEMAQYSHPVGSPGLVSFHTSAR